MCGERRHTDAYVYICMGAGYQYIMALAASDDSDDDGPHIIAACCKLKGIKKRGQRSTYQ